MIKIGISGNRYSGKTFVCDKFKKLSIPVLEADIIMRYLIKYNKDVQEKYSEKLYNFNYDYRKLNNDKEYIDILIDSTEEELFAAYDRFQIKNKNSTYTIFSSSILFEKNWHDLMDFSINVFAPKYTRTDRAFELYKIKRADTSKFILDEMDPLLKNRMASFVIHSYSGTESVDNQINNINNFVIEYNKNKIVAI